MKSREQYKRLVILFASLCVWAMTTVIWALIWDRFFANTIEDPFYSKGNWLLIAVYGILNYSFSKIFGAYRFGFYRLRDVIFSAAGAILIVNSIIYLQTSLIADALLDVRIFLWMTAIDISIIILWSSLAGAVYRRLFPPHKMLVVYGGHDNAKCLVMNMLSRGEKYEIHEVADISEGIDPICEKISGYRAVILCDIKTSQRNLLLKYCYKNSVRVYLTPKLSDMILRGADKIHLFDTPLLLCKNQSLSFEQRLIKRILDLLLTLSVLTVFSPIFLLVALITRLTVKGSIFHTKKMLTINKKEFKLRKFRTMRPVRDNPEQFEFTAAGRIIHFLKLDEMPQLFSIISGKMSIAGPRPVSPEAVDALEESIPEYMFRFKIKAGVTGQSQIIGEYTTSEYDKLKLDLMYIENYSILLDIQIIFTAIRNLVLRRKTPPPKPHEARLEIFADGDNNE